ncbi:MAG: transcriptional repressor [Thermodesulfobacteria bacterium]|nr:transcriptional repressor [Thermodesulfobacteriota bacterium]
MSTNGKKKEGPSELDIFRDFLKRHGMRYTPERETIIKEIFATHEHFDVDSLYISMRQKGLRVSKASIYRLIPLLIQANLIEEVFFEKGQMHYEHTYGHEHHCHLRCQQCSKIEEFSDHRMAQIEEELTKRFNYKILRHRLEVIGLCSDCQKKAQAES